MKTENLHIAIFPIGSIVKFKKEKIKRSDGSSEYLKLIWTLCRQKSVTKISILQKSDWDKCSDLRKQEIDPRGIIYDVYSENNLSTPRNLDKTQKEEVFYLWDTLKDQEKPDFGIGFPAQGFAMVNIPRFLPSIRNPENLTSALNMTIRYSGPIIHYLNMSKIPWYMITTDPRYVKENLKRRDVCNRPLEFISQFNDIINFQSIKEYRGDSDESVTKISSFYSGIEKLNLVNEEIIRPDIEKPNKFSIVAMQSSYGKNDKNDYRFNILKDWVFSKDSNQEAIVFGKWSEYFTNQYPQFKGFLPAEEIDEIFKKTRYTLVIPIRKHWVTSKYAEMLRLGVVPFLHKDYDTQNNLLPKDHYIRVNSPEEFYEKMKFLDENPKKRILLVKNLQGKFLSGVRRGKFLTEIFNEANQRNNIEVEIPYTFDDTVLRKSKSKALF